MACGATPERPLGAGIRKSREMDTEDGPASKLHRYLWGKREARQGEDSRGLGRHEMRVHTESSEDELVLNEPGGWFRHERRRAGESGGPPLYEGDKSPRGSARVVVKG